MPSRLERLLRMEHQIRKGAYPNVETFCQMFGIQPRTVYEDLRMLREMIGLAIAFDRSRNGYYIENPEKTLPSFELTEDEVLALTFAKELLSRLSNGSFEPLLEGALDKIVDRNKSKLLSRVSQVGSFFRVRNNHHKFPPSRTVIDLIKARTEGISVSVTYSPDVDQVPVTTSIAPLCLVLNDGTCYLIGYCTTTKSLRSLSIEKILGVKPTGEAIDQLSGHDLDNFINLTFTP